MNKVFGFGALLLAALLVFNVFFQSYKMFFATSPDVATSVSALSVVWLIVQLGLAVVLWFASRVFIKMG